MKPNSFPVLLGKFFTERLMRQKQVSPHTISAYRDTFRLLLKFTKRHIKKEPSQVTFGDIDTSLITSFLDDLELARRNGARSRNLRLTAIRSFFRYVAYEEPAYAPQIQSVLSIPDKRCPKKLVTSLNRQQTDALLATPDQTTWYGRRDYALMFVAVQTGLRLSELTGLRRQDLHLEAGAHIRCIGKGRKERCTPLTKQSVAIIRGWLRESSELGEWLFPTRKGRQLSRDAVQDILAKHHRQAIENCPSLKDKRVTPHVLRHTFAMELLQAGVDRSVIALWLGHESVVTTQIYLDANLTYKAQILAKTKQRSGSWKTFKPDDPLLTFLKSL